MSDSEEECAVQHIKIVFVGEPNVGKTNLIRRFCYDDFCRQYQATVGAEFHMKRLLLPGKKEVLLKLTDIGGLELTGQMLDKYLFKADMIILVYDITHTASFEKLCAWIDTISNLITSPPFSALVGNKCDLEYQRAVRPERVKQFIKEYGFYNYLASAKSTEMVSACIVELVAKYVGVPLSKLQKEQQQAVIKVEISTPATQNPPKKKKVHVQQTKTSVCILQ